MANLIQSLEESQQGYQQHRGSAYVFGVQATDNKALRWSKLFGIIFIPAAVTALGVSAYQYQQAKQQWLERNVERVEILEKPAPLMELSYPDSGALLSTLREPLVVPEIDNNVAFAAETIDTEPAKTVSMDEHTEDELLEGIDLSDLSPEIAQRLQAAMSEGATSADVASIESANDAAQEFASVAANWHGKLPALNFQTHVYSSNSNKRWVKVNNTEYKEGDWLTSGVQLKAIEPQACVIEVAGEKLRVPALYDWQG